MPEVDGTIPLAQKLKALRQIQFATGQTERPLVRACGITQKEFEVLADERLIEVSFSKDEGPDLDRYYVDKILPAGFAILAQAHAAEPDPVRVSVVSQSKSVWRRMYEGTRSGLWDLLKIAFGAGLGAILAHYFGK